MTTKNFMLAHAISALIVATIFPLIFNYPLYVALQSFGIISLLYILILTFSNIFFYRLPTSIRRVAIGLTTSALTYILILIYIINYASNSYWKTNTTLTLILNSMSQIGEAGDILPVPVWLILAILLLTLLLTIKFYLKNVINLENIATFLTQTQFFSKNTSIRNRALMIVQTILICTGIFSIIGANPSLIKVDNNWYGEPITDLFKPYTTITNTPFITRPAPPIFLI